MTTTRRHKAPITQGGAVEKIGSMQIMAENIQAAMGYDAGIYP